MKYLERRKLKLDGSSFFGNVAGNPAQPESFKVRKGVVCGYRDYLDEHDILICKRIMSDYDYSSRLRNIRYHLFPLDPLANTFL